MNKKDDNWLDDFEVISTYSRAQAIADGVLIDLSELAREAGLAYPTACTERVWNEVIVVPTGLHHTQDEAGRAWDVLAALRHSILLAKSRNEASVHELLFDVLVLMEPEGLRRVTLKSHCGPGDCPAPVLTILMPDED